MNKNEKLIDALGEEFVTKEDSFELVQIDTKIHDEKFETKPTTFAKDAFKRFCKNKSSVVGAVIIAIIMLLTIIVPIASPHNVDQNYVSPSEVLLYPKIFNSGTGFLDGTKEMKEQPYNEVTGLPLGDFPLNTIVGGKDGITYYTNSKGEKVCKFRYDKYEHLLGHKHDDRFSVVTYTEYIENGWMTLTYNKHDSTDFKFEILDERCPITKVYSVSSSGKLNCDYLQYKVLGYKSMPRYIFGTDDKGRDCFTLVFNGLSVSMIFALFISAICFAFGLIWGSISGYFGGNVDLLMERFCDILGGVPSIVIVTLLRLKFGAKFGIFVLALCLTGWLGVAHGTRTQFYRFKGREYVLASRTLGSSDPRLIFKHILPNSLGTIVTSSVLMIPGVIFTESTLSYLGLGIENVITFGKILSSNQIYLETYPALIILPAIVISLLMISFNLFGNGLRDALNPSLKGSD